MEGWPAFLAIQTLGHGGPVGRAEAFCEEDQKFGSQLSQTNDLQKWYLSLPSLVLAFNKIAQRLVNPVWQ